MLVYWFNNKAVKLRRGMGDTHYNCIYAWRNTQIDLRMTLLITYDTCDYFIYAWYPRLLYLRTASHATWFTYDMFLYSWYPGFTRVRIDLHDTKDHIFTHKTCFTHSTHHTQDLCRNYAGMNCIYVETRLFIPFTHETQDLPRIYAMRNLFTHNIQ